MDDYKSQLNDKNKKKAISRATEHSATTSTDINSRSNRLFQTAPWARCWRREAYKRPLKLEVAIRTVQMGSALKLYELKCENDVQHLKHMFEEKFSEEGIHSSNLSAQLLAIILSKYIPAKYYQQFENNLPNYSLFANHK